MKYVLATLVSLLFFGCSGGGGGGGSATGDFGSTVSAQFIDAPVKGLSFSTSSSTSGTTAAQGKFSCKRGDIVNFSLKGLKLGQAACGEKVFVHDLYAPAGVTGHTWGKAAAAIQSFATGTSELDLSAAQSSSLDLSSVTFAAGFDTAIQNKVSGSGLGTSHVTTSNAETAANNSLADHAALSDTFAAGLDELIATNQGKFLVKATLTKGTKVGGEEWCDTKVDALFTVSSETISAKKIYKLTPTKAISYLETSDADAGAECKSGAVSCYALTGELLPKAKVLAGTKFDVATSASVTDYRNLTGLDIELNTIVAMSATVTGDDVKVGGTFYSEMTVLNTSDSNYDSYKGQKIACTFKID